MNALARQTAAPLAAGNSKPETIGRDESSVISDQEFLGELEKHKDAFYRFVKRTAFNQASADDIFSSAVLSAYESRQNFTPGTNFRAWMYRILLNKCFVANRESMRTRQLYDCFEPAQPPSGAMASWKSLHNLEDVLEDCGDEVYHAFQRLSFAQRVCLLLRIVEQLSYREIAEVLEIPQGTVTTHLARGRRKLRAELSEYARRRRLVTSSGRRLQATKPAALAHT